MTVDHDNDTFGLYMALAIPVIQVGIFVLSGYLASIMYN